MALVFEYKINVMKINDNCLVSIDGNLIFKIDPKIIKWKVNKSPVKEKIFYKLFLKIFIRFIHLIFYFLPFSKSYKVGSNDNYPKFIFADNLKNNLSIKRLIKETKEYNVVLSGWGLRDWDMVLKHKNSISKVLQNGLNEFSDYDEIYCNDYLLVHIRRKDFLEVNEFKDLNFEDKIWIKSIKKLCCIKGINKVVLFSDSLIKKNLIYSLKKNSLSVMVPEIGNRNINFLKLFFSYTAKSKFILCNASSLTLSLAFLSHEKVYLPSIKEDFQEIYLNNAHNSYPALLNWN